MLKRYIAMMLATLLCVFGSQAGAGQSDDDRIARAHYATGIEYYDRAQYRLAAREFEEAYRLAPRPPLLYDIARSCQKLGDLGRAVEFYEAYLLAAPSALETELINGSLATMRPRVAEVRITSRAKVAALFVDGEPRRMDARGALWVTAGRRSFALRSEGALEAVVHVELRGGERRSLTLDPLDPKTMSERARAPRPRWLWPVVGVSAVVVAAVAVTLGLTLGRTDYTDRGRATCTGPSCLLIDGTQAPK